MSRMPIGPGTQQGATRASFGKRTLPPCSENEGSEAFGPGAAPRQLSLAAILAHELAQPVTAAANFIRITRELMKEQVKGLEALRAMTDLADEQLARASDVFRRIREFHRGGTLMQEVVDLRAVIDAAVARVGAMGRAEFEVALPVEGVSAFVDPGLVEQVIANLLTNAVEAVADCPERRVRIEGEALGMRAMLRITDTGHGFPAGSLERAFDPLFTTKPCGGGLGLAISRAIVDAHGGRLWAEAPSSGDGAILMLVLPADAPGRG